MTQPTDAPDTPPAPVVGITFEAVVEQAQALVPDEPNKLAYVVQRTWDAVNASDVPVTDVTATLAGEASQWDTNNAPGGDSPSSGVMAD